jgi:hypothetical protein
MPHNDSEARPHDPETPGEWQEAIDAAEFFLAVDSAEKYGLITGPAVKLERALELLERGRALGYTPAPMAELIRRYLC